MKIGITGGFGFVGGHLLSRLARENYELVLLSNKKRSLTQQVSSVTIKPGQVEDLESLQAAFDGCDAIIHLVGLIAETKEKTFAKTVAEGTANIVTAAQKGGVKHIVYLSALGTKKDAASKYHQTKYQAEQAIINSGLTYTILRASVIYGPGDGFVSLLTKMIKQSPITPVIGDGKYKLQPVHIDEVCEAITKSLVSANSINRIINIAGQEELEYLEILDILKAVLGKKRMNLHLPVAVMRFIAGIMETIMSPAPLTKDQLLMMTAGNCGDITDMREIFHIEPKKFKDGLLTYMRNHHG